LPSRWIEERGMFVDSAGKPLKANYDEFTKAAKLAADAELEYCNDEGFAWKPKCLENKVTLPEEHAVIEFEAEGEDGTKDLANFVDQLPAKQRRRLKLVDLKVDIKSLKAKAASKMEESGKDVKMAKKSAQVLLQKGREMLAEKLKTMSRQEALAEMVCRAGTSLKKKKNLKTKPSAKTKPSLKNKPSLKKKPSFTLKPSLKSKPSTKLKKSFVMKAKAKMLQKEILKKAAKADIEDFKMEATEMKGNHLQIGAFVLVADEKAGTMLYSKTGILKSIKENNLASVDFAPAFGIVQLKLEYLISGKGSKDKEWKAFEFLKPMTNLSKNIKEGWLKLIQDEIFQPHADGAWLLDQHLTVAMEYLKFGLNLKADEVSYVDPTCSKIFWQVAHEADLADLEQLQAFEAFFIVSLQLFIE